MEIEKLPLIIADINMRLDALEKGVKPSNKDLSAMIEPTIVDGNIFIPLLGKTLAVEHIDNEENYTWKQAMDYCKSKGLELPSKEDALILIWQIDKINALLKQLGKDEIGNNWGWTKSESSAANAWHWYDGGWTNIYKTSSYCVVPFFAIN